MKKNILLKGFLGTLSIGSVVGLTTFQTANKPNTLIQYKQINHSLTRVQYLDIEMIQQSNSYTSSSNEKIYKLNINYVDGTVYTFNISMKYEFKQLTLKIWVDKTLSTYTDYQEYIQPNLLMIANQIESEINKAIKSNWNDISIILKSISLQNAFSSSSSLMNIDIPIKYTVVDYEVQNNNATTLTVVSVFMGIFAFTTLVLTIAFIKYHNRNKNSKTVSDDEVINDMHDKMFFSKMKTNPNDDVINDIHNKEQNKENQ